MKSRFRHLLKSILVTAIIGCALSTSSSAEDGSCSIYRNTFDEQRVSAVNFAVLQACDQSIDKTTKYSAWGGWRACFCGSKFGLKQTYESLSTAAQHPIATAAAFVDFISDLRANMDRIEDELSAQFLKHAELSFEEKKAINCQVVFQVAFYRTAVPQAANLAMGGIRSVAKVGKQAVRLATGTTVSFSRAQKVIVTSAQAKVANLCSKFGLEQNELFQHVSKTGQYFRDLREGRNNINILAPRPDGRTDKMIRITLDPNSDRIISAGMLRRSQMDSWIENREFLAIELPK